MGAEREENVYGAVILFYWPRQGEVSSVQRRGLTGMLLRHARGMVSKGRVARLDNSEGFCTCVLNAARQSMYNPIWGGLEGRKNAGTSRLLEEILHASTVKTWKSRSWLVHLWFASNCKAEAGCNRSTEVHSRVQTVG